MMASTDTPKSKIIDFHGVKAAHYGIVVLRLLFLATLVLTIAGVRMLVQMDNPAVMRIGKGLAEAGSVMALVLLTVCVGGELFVWARHGNKISPCSKRVRFTRSDRTEHQISCEGLLMDMPDFDGKLDR